MSNNQMREALQIALSAIRNTPELYRSNYALELGAQALAAESAGEAIDLTDSAMAALLWVLYHHQGGGSPVGQPIRFALGMGQFDRLTDEQIQQAKAWNELEKQATAKPADEAQPVAKVDADDDNIWAEILPDRDVKVGQLLYTHPAPEAVRKLEFKQWVEIGQRYKVNSKVAEAIFKDALDAVRSEK